MITTTRGEVTCLNCGRFLGEVERLERANPPKKAFKYRPAGGGAVQTSTGLRCSHCNGKAIVEFLERVKRAAA